MRIRRRREKRTVPWNRRSRKGKKKEREEDWGLEGAMQI